MKKTLKRVLLIVISIVIILALAFFILFLYADAVRFDYVDFSIRISDDESDELERKGYSLVLPFFGNSMSLNDMGDAKHYLFGFIGEENEPIYYEVNSVLYQYAIDTVSAYENRVKTDYEVQNDGKTLTVCVKGTAYPYSTETDSVEINEVFSFNIENAGTEKLPYLISRSGSADNGGKPAVTDTAVQPLTEDDIELDGVPYSELSPEQVIQLYGKYSCDKDIQRLNILIKGGETEGYTEDTPYMMLSDFSEITEDTEIHNNEYSHVDGMSVYQVRCKAKFSDNLTTPNEPTDYFTFIALQNDGEYWRICKIFTGI